MLRSRMASRSSGESVVTTGGPYIFVFSAPAAAEHAVANRFRIQPLRLRAAPGRPPNS